MMKVAIVGPEESKWPTDLKRKAKNVITTLLTRHAFCETLADEPFADTSREVDWSKITLVSGHCPKGGVDIWAEEISDQLGIKKEIYTPEVNQWEDKINKIPFNKNEVEEYQIDTTELEFDGYYYYRIYRQKGYRSRNIQIAKVCDVLYCIVPHIPSATCRHCKIEGHPTNGGCWTMKYAEKLGKEVHLEVVR